MSYRKRAGRRSYRAKRGRRGTKKHRYTTISRGGTRM